MHYLGKIDKLVDNSHSDEAIAIKNILEELKENSRKKSSLNEFSIIENEGFFLEDHNQSKNNLFASF